eukprot:3032347-Pyramimonas_sp.AAC.1
MLLDGMGKTLNRAGMGKAHPHTAASGSYPVEVNTSSTCLCRPGGLLQRARGRCSSKTAGLLTGAPC